MQVLVFAASFAALCFVIFLLLSRFDRRLGLAGGLLFAIYLGLDDLATSLPALAPALNLFDGQWNWSGKLYSLALAAIVVLGLGLSSRDIGLTLPRRNLKTSLLALMLLTLLSLSLGLWFKPSMPSAETLAFQFLMPGLAEELAYRGIAPALLLGLAARAGPAQGTPWVVIVITALAFGAWHGLVYTSAGFSFDVMSALFPLLGGVAYGWLRFHSGSLLLPVLAHGCGNTAFHLSAFLPL